MRRKWREVKSWRSKHTAKHQCECTECLKPILPGQYYERRVMIETSDMLSRENIVVHREHLSPGCNQYER